MIRNELVLELKKLAEDYHNFSVALLEHQVSDKEKPLLDKIISCQDLLVSKLTRAAQEEDYVFNISFYADDLKSYYKQALAGISGNPRYHELRLDLEHFQQIHEIQSEQLISIHELMGSAPGFNN